MIELEIPKMNIYQRLHGIMSEVGSLPKTKEIKKDGKTLYKVVESEKLDSALQPLLKKYRVFIEPTTKRLKSERVTTKKSTYETTEHHTTIILKIKWVNIDKPDDFVEGEWPGFSIDKGDKAIGKAGTYAFRIGRTKTLGISTGDREPEEDEIEPKKEEKAKATIEKKEQKPAPAPTPESKPSSGDFATEAQAKRLTNFAKSLKVSDADLSEYLKKNNINSTFEIPKDRFDGIRSGVKHLPGLK